MISAAGGKTKGEYRMAEGKLARAPGGPGGGMYMGGVFKDPNWRPRSNTHRYATLDERAQTTVSDSVGGVVHIDAFFARYLPTVRACRVVGKWSQLKLLRCLCGAD